MKVFKLVIIGIFISGCASQFDGVDVNSNPGSGVDARARVSGKDKDKKSGYDLSVGTNSSSLGLDILNTRIRTRVNSSGGVSISGSAR